MSRFVMEFYNSASGVQFELEWKDEQQFLLAKAFLKELLSNGFGPSTLRPGKTPFYYLENDLQRDALFAFQQRLEKGP